MALLNKKDFCEIINNIKKDEECIDSLNDILREYNKELRISSLLYEYNDLLKVLKFMFDDQSDWIGYWIYDLNYGKKYKDGCITEADGTDIILKTSEDLYDFLIKEMNNKENDNYEN